MESKESGNDKFIQSDKFFNYILISIFLLGAFLRLYRLGYKSLWFDEISTLDDAKIATYLFWTKTHAIYFALVRFFLRFGQTEFWLRFVSFLFGSLGPVAIYFAGREIFKDKRVGMLAALFTATSLVHLLFSQEARYYSAIFFFSALALFLFGRFINRFCIVSLCLMPVVCYANYLIHPTALVFSGILLAWVPLSFLISREGRNKLIAWWNRLVCMFWKKQIQAKKNPVPKQKGKRNIDKNSNVFKKCLVILLIVILLGVGIWSGKQIFQVVKSQSRNIKLFKSPAEGVRANFNFFFNDHFIYYSSVIKPNTIFNTYIVGLFILFSLVGYFRTLVRQFPFGSFCVVCIGVTFTLLFSVPIKQYYSSKYVMFLFPANILCIFYGLVTFADFINSLLNKRVNRNPVRTALCVYAIILIPILYNNMRMLKSNYKHKGTDVKSIVETFSKEHQPEDIVGAYGLIVGPVRYYIQYFNIPLSSFKTFRWEKGDGTRTIQVMQKAALDGGNIWFIFGWPHDIPPKLNEWVEKNFELVARHKTLPADPKYDVTLWRWKHKDRLLLKDKKISINLMPSPPNAYSASSEFYTLHPIEAILEYAGKRGDLPTSATMSFMLNGKPLMQYVTRPMDMPRFALEIPEGANHLSFQLNDESVDSPRTFPFILRSAHPERQYFNAVAYDSCSPTYDVISQESEGHNYQILPYNSYVSYNVNVPADGNYEFALKGKNDKPGPIFLHIEVDEKPVGVLSFEKGDESWEMRRMPMKLQKGQNEITIYFVSDVRTKDEDNDAFLAYFFLEQAPSWRPLMDQRVLVAREILVPLSKSIKDMKLINPMRKTTWKPTGYENPRNEKLNVNGVFIESIAGEIPHDSKGGYFISPAVPVKENDFVYFSIKGRVQNLDNHSANVLVALLNKNMEIIGKTYVNAQGITKSVNEVKFVCLRPVTKDSAYVVLYLAVYANSVRQFTHTGTVWFYDFVSDVDMIKNF